MKRIRPIILIVVVAAIAAAAGVAWSIFRDPVEVSEFKRETLNVVAEIRLFANAVSIDPGRHHEKGRGKEVYDQWTRLPNSPEGFKIINTEVAEQLTRIIVINEIYDDAIKQVSAIETDADQLNRWKAAAKRHLDQKIDEIKSNLRAIEKRLKQF